MSRQILCLCVDYIIESRKIRWEVDRCVVPVVHCLKFVLFTAKFHCTQACNINLALGCIFSYDGHHTYGTLCCPVPVERPENPLIPRISSVSGRHPCVHYNNYPDPTMAQHNSSRYGDAPQILLDHARSVVPGLEARWPRYARYITEITVRPRTVLLNEGDVPRKIFFVRKGCLRASLSSRGKEITFQFFFEGDAVVSIEGFRKAQPSPISITAVEACELSVLKKEGFDLILRENPEVKDLLLELAFQRFSDYSRLFLSHLRDTPRQRYLALMHEDPRLLERVPQRYIASYLGVTPVSLSRIRHRR